MTNTELEELEALLAKATTRPWKVDTTDNVGKNWLICGGFGKDPDGSTPIITTDNLSGLQCVTGLASDDAKAMCAAVMAADSLIARIRKLEAVAEAARRSLMAYPDPAFYKPEEFEAAVLAWVRSDDRRKALEEVKP